jgi:imidazolonepropionase-like amidohydrolase
MEAIRSTTMTAGEALGMHAELGTIEAGKLADIIVVDGDPLRDIGVLQDDANIKLVMKGGEVLKSTLSF